MKVYIITQHDLVYYPPMQTLINVMQKMGLAIYFVGNYSDEESKKQYEKKGVIFESIVLNEEGNSIQKIYRQKQFAKDIDRFLNNTRITDTDLIWYVYSGATVCALSGILYKHKFIVHFYEFYNSLQSWKYKLIYPSYNLRLFLHKAKGVVHCEYNRAQICKSLYGLESLPYIIPNKPYIDQAKLSQVPADIMESFSSFKKTIEGKKVIIYQGYFNAKERRLEEFCQAVNLLPKDYVLVIMGRGSDYFDALKVRYESKRIIFVPFVRPPYHLKYTQKATIGILTYYPQEQTYPGVINPLYCAPNKIFEYGMYGVPMIGNDIPGLKYVFSEFNCGETLKYPITPQKIVDCIVKIENRYKDYSDGALNLNDSVNIEKTISDIIQELV